MASRLLPQNICRRTLADLQLLVSAGTDRNSTTSSVRHGGVDEDKYALGIGEIMGMKDEDKPTLSEKDVSRLPIDHLCVEDYPSRATAMMNQLQRVTGLGCLFVGKTSGEELLKLPRCCSPIDVLGENHTASALSRRAGGLVVPLDFPICALAGR